MKKGDDGEGKSQQLRFQRVGGRCKPIPLAKNSSPRSHRENGKPQENAVAQ